MTDQKSAALSESGERFSLMEKTNVEPANAFIRSFFADTYLELGEVAQLSHPITPLRCTNRKNNGAQPMICSGEAQTSGETCAIAVSLAKRRPVNLTWSVGTLSNGRCARVAVPTNSGC